MNKLSSFIVVSLVLCVYSTIGIAATFTVNSTLDLSLSGGATCPPVLPADQCTLRGAIESANGAVGSDLIDFNIPASDPGCSPGGVCVINVVTAGGSFIPDIVDTVTIDGSTQPGNADVCLQGIPLRPVYKIVVQGDGIDIGFRFEQGSDNSVVRGLNVRGFFNGIVFARSNDSVAECNFVGTDENGVAGIANASNGIILICDSQRNLVGGPDPEDGNLISGNTLDGVQFFGGTSCGAGSAVAPKNNTVQSNFIGTAKDGITPLGNAANGVSFFGAVAPDTFSGNDVLGNVIADGQGGVSVYGPATTTSVRGNFIGTDLSGAENLGHDFDGVYFENASGNTVGGPNAGDANVLAFNAFAGVSSFGSAIGNRFQRNIIYSNGDVGIDLNIDGATANDPGDVDTGPNNLQNTPVFVTSTWNPPNIDITYSVDSPGVLTVEFFVADGGQGRTFLAEDSYVLAGASKAVSIPAGGAASTDDIVATATDASGNTSEFSSAVSVPVQLQSFSVE